MRESCCANIQRTHTAVAWASDNPVLARGEFGVEIDTFKLKVGNGVSVWNDLPYVTASGSGGSTFKYGLYSQLTDQSYNLAVGQHVEFDNCQGSLGGMSQGSGQQLGRITLAAGKTYKLTFALRGHWNVNEGWFGVGVFNINSGQFIGKQSITVPNSYTLDNHGAQPTGIAVFTPTVETTIELRITYSQAMAYIMKEWSWLLIEEYWGV